MIRKSIETSLATRAQTALLNQLPFNKLTVRGIKWLMEPKHLKTVGLVVIGGSVAASVLKDISERQKIRSTMAKELKKQLEPINKKLAELEEQNEELKKQNEKLEKALRHSSAPA